jgi:hypothetical protein
MKRHVQRFAPFVLLLVLVACAPVSIQTPQGKQAYTADQIVIRLNELQNAAIQANSLMDPKTGLPGLPTPTTRIIVQFVVSSDKTLKDLPAGWQQTVATAWAETKRQLPIITNPAVSVAIGSVDVVLAALGGSQ